MLAEQVVTDATVFGTALAVALFFIKRWIDRIEEKVDRLYDQRSLWITRDEFNATVMRIHTRIDTKINGAGGDTKVV